MKTLPISLRYHSSQILQRKLPQSSGSIDQSVTIESGVPGRAADESWIGMDSGSHFCGAVLSKTLGSTQGMNCICRGRTSFFRKRYTSNGFFAFIRFITERELNGTPKLWRS